MQGPETNPFVAPGREASATFAVHYRVLLTSVSEVGS